MDHTQTIAVIGGTGKAGGYMASEALRKGYRVRMLVRNPAKVKETDSRVEIIQGTVQDVHWKEFLNGCDAVINTFGQPMRSTPIYSELTDHILQAMRELNIKRYIVVTGGSLTIEGDRKRLVNVMGALLFKLLFAKTLKDRHQEWKVLKQYEQIDWTLVRLPFIVEGEGTEKVKEHLTDMPGTKIMSRDIASFLIQLIEEKKYIQQAPFIANAT